VVICNTDIPQWLIPVAVSTAKFAKVITLYFEEHLVQVTSLLEATIFSRKVYRKHKLWNIVSTEMHIYMYMLFNHQNMDTKFLLVKLFGTWFNEVGVMYN